MNESEIVDVMREMRQRPGFPRDAYESLCETFWEGDARTACWAALALTVVCVRHEPIRIDIGPHVVDKLVCAIPLYDDLALGCAYALRDLVRSDVDLKPRSIVLRMLREMYADAKFEYAMREIEHMKTLPPHVRPEPFVSEPLPTLFEFN